MHFDVHKLIEGLLASLLIQISRHKNPSPQTKKSPPQGAGFLLIV